MTFLKRLQRLISNQVTTELSPKPKTSDATTYLFFLCRIAGLCKPTQLKGFYILYAFVFNVVIGILFPTMFVLSYVIDWEKFQINELLSSLQAFFGSNASTLKFFAIIFLRQYFFKIEYVLNKLDARITYSKEIREAEKCIQFCNRIVVTYVFFYYTSSMSTFMAAVYIGRPPFSLHIPYFNWRESTLNLVVSFVIEYILLNGLIVHQLINDTYAVVFTVTLQSHLKILIMRVLRIGTDPKCTQKENYEELVRCLHDHKNIIELMNTISPVISSTYFIQFLVTTSNLVATLINVNFATERYTLVGMFLFAFCLIMEILPICYIANSLAAESDLLPDAIFHMNWMDQSPEFKRLCLLFMHRSQKTIVFYAGKMFAISLDTFVSIIKFTFSVYTLLDNMNFADRFSN